MTARKLPCKPEVRRITVTGYGWATVDYTPCKEHISITTYNKNKCVRAVWCEIQESEGETKYVPVKACDLPEACG